MPVIEAPGPWTRIHRRSREALHFGRSGNGRFDTPGGEFGVLYLAADAHCAFAETFGQSTGVSTVTTVDLSERVLSRAEAARPLRLVDLTGPGLARLGADERLCAGEHVVAQRWALALWWHPETPDGLLYRARHGPSRLCAAVFDRAGPPPHATLVGGLLDPAQVALLGDLLDTCGFGLA